MLSPFRGFYDAQSEVDRLFNEMLGGLSRGRGAREGSSSPSGRPLWTCSPGTGIW
jgi:hypothetical protein